MRVSGSTSSTSTPPTVSDPELWSQRRAARRAQVDLPLPDGPTNAVTSPSFAVNDTPSSVASPSDSYEKPTLSNTTS